MEEEEKHITADELNAENDASTIYDAPKDVVEEITVPKDPNEKEFKDMDHYEKLAFVSAQRGIMVKKPNHNCRACYGRGYVSVTSVTVSGEDGDITEQIPNACKCIYSREDYHKVFSGKAFLNRKLQRQLDRKEGKKNKIGEEQAKLKKKKLKEKKKKKRKNKKR